MSNHIVVSLEHRLVSISSQHLLQRVFMLIDWFEPFSHQFFLSFDWVIRKENWNFGNATKKCFSFFLIKMEMVQRSLTKARHSGYIPDWKHFQ